MPNTEVPKSNVVSLAERKQARTLDRFTDALRNEVAIRPGDTGARIEELNDRLDRLRKLMQNLSKPPGWK